MSTTSTASIAGEHVPHLAVEQIYCYIVCNGKSLAILTTMKDFCFLQRFNRRILQMTPIYRVKTWGPMKDETGDDCSDSACQHTDPYIKVFKN